MKRTNEERKSKVLKRALAVAEKAVASEQWDNTTGLQYVEEMKRLAEESLDNAEEALSNWDGGA